MTWLPLTEPEEVDSLIRKSHDKPVGIFKHSTRCGTSLMAKAMFERDWSQQSADIDIYLIDILKHRPASNRVADVLEEHHESPQFLLVKDGECLYEASHNHISVEEIMDELRIEN